MNQPRSNNLPALSSAVLTLTAKLARRFDMGDVDPAELALTLKATAFKNPNNGEPVTDAQMAALLVVADQYGLNPWLKEIHAFPAKGGGIVPIVGVDGWSNIINSHPQMDGMEFEVNWEKGNEHITCSIWRKDRNRPIKVSEWLEECIRGTDPWKMKRRMLRHKAMMQCGRVAFGYGNIFDPDEAQDVLANGEKFMGPVEVLPQQQAHPTAAAGQSPMPNTGTGELPEWPDEAFDKKVPKFQEYLAKGKTVQEIVDFYGKQGRFTAAQMQRLHALAGKKDGAEPTVIDNAADAVVLTFAQVAERLSAAKNLEELTLAADLIRQVADETHRTELTALFEARGEELPSTV